MGTGGWKFQRGNAERDKARNYDHHKYPDCFCEINAWQAPDSLTCSNLFLVCFLTLRQRPEHKKQELWQQRRQSGHTLQNAWRASESLDLSLIYRIKSSSVGVQKSDWVHRVSCSKHWNRWSVWRIYILMMNCECMIPGPGTLFLVWGSTCQLAVLECWIQIWNNADLSTAGISWHWTRSCKSIRKAGISLSKHKWGSNHCWLGLQRFCM